MTPQEAQALRSEIAELRQIINLFVQPSDYRFIRPIIGGTDGLRLNTLAAQKLSVFDKTPIAQWSSGTGRQDVSATSGGAAAVGTQYTGNTGSTGYSVGDVIAALKGYGFLAA